ncbi:unnamed protein product [Parnassius apollo]|uniref:(apollo) hypothetical protein n=1 Tax=Parnassius apollo TaxID=110799 RepID=A0A8S3XH34_PARAO|nr:unnamed protein product [Parnassius apollo]
MPLKRTPPLTPTNLNVGVVHSQTHSDPNLSISVDIEDALSNVTQRNFNTKRKRENLGEKSDLDDFKSLMMNMFQELKTTMNEIKDQNKELKESVKFTAAKYDEVWKSSKKIEKDMAEDRKYIRQLEDKIDQLERQARTTSLEIRNLPKANDESKQGISKIVVEIGKIINMPIHEADVKKNKPLVNDLKSVILKERILHAVKKIL